MSSQAAARQQLLAAQGPGALGAEVGGHAAWPVDDIAGVAGPAAPVAADLGFGRIFVS